ncbi:MAG: NAD(P)-dependent oxidoreductase [Dokdonella sp.]|uniref:NAD(P)-dependent oxidoreductase n=1 Tax=Dokdonella sp. TaxID=2291710 RepID=UPI003BAE8E98
MSDIKAGFVGLGAMGRPMAGHLSRAGLLASAWTRTPANTRAVAVELGLDEPASLAELAARCNVIALCVPADAHVLANVEVIATNAQPGTIVIDHSTVSSVTAVQACERMRVAGGEFIDAPVSGGVEGARNGKLSIMVGGDASALERARPVLECYAAKISHMGGIGAGQNTKAVNQVLVAGIAQAVCEGLALGEALGLDADSLIPTLLAGAAGNWFLDKRGATMLRDEFQVGFKLGLLHKDLKIVRELARDAGTDRSGIEKSLADYAVLMAQGHADDDISALIRLKRAAASG